MEDHRHENRVLVNGKCLCVAVKVYGVSIGSRGYAVQLSPQTSARSPSFPHLGDSQLPLLCLSTPALSTPHCSLHTDTPESRPGDQQRGGTGTKDCGRGALGTFVLFSVPLCFQSKRTSVNKHRLGHYSGPSCQPRVLYKRGLCSFPPLPQWG